MEVGDQARLLWRAEVHLEREDHRVARDGEGGGVDRRQHLKHTHVRGERVPVLDDWFACDAHECFACDVCVRVVHQCMTVGAP